MGNTRTPRLGERVAICAFAVTSNAVNYVEIDGHFSMLDESGGKPLTGYGSGSNGDDSPEATPQESAAMLIAAASQLVSEGRKMCLGNGGYDFRGSFCQSVLGESLVLRGRANRFVGAGAWSAAGLRMLNTSNTALLVGAAGCGIFTLATAGTGGIACAAIYAGAAATSAASTVVTAKKVMTRQGNALDDVSFISTLASAVCLSRMKGEARKACAVIGGTISGIMAASATAEDMRRARDKRFRTMDR